MLAALYEVRSRGGAEIRPTGAWRDLELRAEEDA